MPIHSLSRRLGCLALAAGIGAATLLAPTHANANTEEAAVVRALDRAAHPLASTEPGGHLRDLRPLGRLVGDAAVVGLGEATHGSHEFFTLKHRVFRYLVEHKGFRAFALEASWSTGLRLNDYVHTGQGDPRQIMREEFRGAAPWQVEEYVELIAWMRAYNQRNPHDMVSFVGDDAAYPTLGTELCDKVTAYVERTQPELLPKFDELYARVRTIPDADAFLALPPAERKAMAHQAKQAYDLLRSQRPPTDSQAFEWTLQHAKVFADTLTMLAYDLADPAELAQAMLLRDRLMAETTVWWYEHTGQRILLSAHNGHIAYVSDMPEQYPKTQGAFLRDLLGRRYVTIGTTFGEGGFNSRGSDGLGRRRIGCRSRIRAVTSTRWTR